MKYKIIRKLFGGFKVALPYILLVCGIGCYVVGFLLIENDSWKEVVVDIGQLLLIGVLLDFISNSAKYMGIFKSELINVIYAKDLLKNRKDIYMVWENISKQLLNDKFQNIHTDFFQLIKSYIDTDDSYYFQDYVRTMTVDWKDKSQGLISIFDVIDFDVMAETTEQIELSFRTISNTQSNIHEVHITNLTIDGKEVKNIPHIIPDSKDNKLHNKIQILLKDKKQYNVHLERNRVLDVNKDYYIGWKAKQIINNAEIQVVIPADIEAQFISRGTKQDFKDVVTAIKALRFNKKYDGIILPNQGFVMAFRVIKDIS